MVSALNSEYLNLKLLQEHPSFLILGFLPNYLKKLLLQVGVFYWPYFILYHNGMLRHSFGGAVIIIYLQHFIAPALDWLPCLQAGGTRDCNKGSKFKKGAFIMALFNKMDSRREAILM